MSFDRIKRIWNEHRHAENLRRQLAEQLKRTPAGRLASEVDRVARTRSSTKATADRLKRQFEQITSGANREAASRTRVANQIREIERYAMSTPGGAWGWLGKVFGPIADAVKSLLRPFGKPQSKREIESAAELLNALGASTEGPSGRRVRIESENLKAKEDAEKILEALGFEIDRSRIPSSQQPDLPDTPLRPVVPLPPGATAPPNRIPQPTPRFEPANPPDPTSGMVRKMLNGMFVYFRPDDPAITGAMIRVQSSNVHSIGFDWNDRTPEKGTLKVAFLDHQKGGSRNGKGATYYYYDVHPKIFFDFQRAASKGKFVWDQLRVRGTVSGHKYRYRLAAISKSGYVPRQATRIGDEEYFFGRNVKGQNGKEYRSALADRFVRKLTPKQQGMPRSLFPNTGRPSNGRR